jgi:hypothetical protein
MQYLDGEKYITGSMAYYRLRRLQSKLRNFQSTQLPVTNAVQRSLVDMETRFKDTITPLLYASILDTRYKRLVFLDEDRSEAIMSFKAFYIQQYHDEYNLL